VRRRDFVILLGGAAAGCPFRAQAQQAAIPAIGYLSGRSLDAETYRTSILAALEEAGFVVGRNVTIEYRFAEGRDEHLPMLASDLVRRAPTLLVATDRPSALAVEAATTTIPIVFGAGEDPVQLGLVASLNRPGGNATGVSSFGTELGPKRLGLLREALPKPGLIAFVVNPNAGSTPPQVESLQSAARSLGQPLLVVPAGTEAQVDEAFAIMVQRKVAGIVYGATVFFASVTSAKRKIAALVGRRRSPARWKSACRAGMYCAPPLTSWLPVRPPLAWAHAANGKSRSSYCPTYSQ